jgi:endonuclease/exonuclease/phosphatase family metal-dependent hydrolase
MAQGAQGEGERKHGMKNNLTRQQFLKASWGTLASAYFMGLAGFGGKQASGQVQSDRQVQGAVADLQASEDTTLRIMAWNIGEGRTTAEGNRTDTDAQLPKIAEYIRAQYPDIVLLNEIMIWYPGFGVDQVTELSKMTGLPYYQWGKTTDMWEYRGGLLGGYYGNLGMKVAAILSRFELVDPRVHPQPNTNEFPYATLEATALVNGVAHRVFSTRIEKNAGGKASDDHKAGFEHSANLVRALDASVPVIFGGDFNSPIGSPGLVGFTNDSGLVNAAVERPDPEACDDIQNIEGGAIDHIFFRGPYQVAQTKIPCDRTLWDASDHAWVLAVLSDSEPSAPEVPQNTLRVDREIIVRESDGDVDTGIDVGPGDEYAFEAWGSIWAGVAFTGRNGPQGWNYIDHDPKFPLHEGDNAHPFSLLGRFAGLPYFYIGGGRARERYLDPQVRRLLLRINDDQPGNGSGEFYCRVQVWGDEPRKPRRPRKPRKRSE